jgi:hypothetical protein
MVYKNEKDRYDWRQAIKNLYIIPVRGSKYLSSATSLVRLPEGKHSISDEAWSFLESLLPVIDPRWLNYLNKWEDKTGLTQKEILVENSNELLKALQLDQPSPVDEIADRACKNLFSRNNVEHSAHVLMCHILAALYAETPNNFRCITCDGKSRPISDEIIASHLPWIEDLLPEEWIAENVLHPDYFKDFTACSEEQWSQWLCSPKSGFKLFPIIKKKITISSSVQYKLPQKAREFAKLRKYDVWLNFYSHVVDVWVDDFDFPEQLIKHWEALNDSDPTLWAKVVQQVLLTPDWFWQPLIEGEMWQSSYIKKRKLCTVTAKWIHDLKSKSCLFDTNGKPREPAELYLRNAQTEPLIGIEPFVKKSLDKEENQPFLLLLGVRDSPHGIEKLLDRLRGLAKVPDPKAVQPEILKWYSAIDKVISSSNQSPLGEARRAFNEESLILTNTLEWAKAKEVYCFPSEEYPDAPTVNSEVSELNLWRKVGVAECPSEATVIDSLNKLTPGVIRDEKTRRRVEAALSRFPQQVWDKCGHWLTLDNAWTPISSIRYRLSTRDSSKGARLFAAVKARTANLKFVPSDIVNQVPFSDLNELESLFEYRPSVEIRSIKITDEIRSVKITEKPAWLSQLASLLRRVGFDGNQTKTERVHNYANKLIKSNWCVLPKEFPLCVTPYLDGNPVGEPEPRNVFWFAEKIYIKDCNPAKKYSELINELTHSLADLPDIKETFKACYDRSFDFIRDFMQENFIMLEPSLDEHNEPSSPALDKLVQAIEWKADRFFEGDLNELEDQSPAEEVEGRLVILQARESIGHQRDKLFTQYVKKLGFQWDTKWGIFTHKDGSSIRKAEPPMKWERHNPTGEVIAYYWVNDACLISPGVEVPFEVWELVQQQPKEIWFVLRDWNKHPVGYQGLQLMEMREKQLLQIYPSRYRLRLEIEG